jgi:hypothetical protein
VVALAAALDNTGCSSVSFSENELDPFPAAGCSPHKRGSRRLCFQRRYATNAASSGGKRARSRRKHELAHDPSAPGIFKFAQLFGCFLKCSDHPRFWRIMEQRSGINFTPLGDSP